MEFIGTGNNSYVYKATDPLTQMQFPFTYNSTFTDHTTAEYSVNGIDVTRSGTVTMAGDGYGSIALPAGTVNNVLRVKSTQFYNDTFWSSGMPIATGTSTTTAYIWFSETIKSSLLTISYTEQTQGAQTLNAKQVTYYPNSLTGLVRTMSDDLDLTIAPNPLRDKAVISFDLKRSGSMRMEVTDITGRSVQTEDMGNLHTGRHTLQFSCESLPNGLYFVRLYSDNQPTEAFKLKVSR
jgi:hypothetical protein